MIAWPNTLIEDIARRNCVIFLGSGISCNSTNADGEKPKSWRVLLENGANKHINNNDLKDQIIRKVSQGDYLLACEMLKRGMGDESFSDYLKKEYLDKRFDEADIHKTIFELDSRIVISPNVDEIYERLIPCSKKIFNISNNAPGVLLVLNAIVVLSLPVGFVSMSPIKTYLVLLFLSS